MPRARAACSAMSCELTSHAKLLYGTSTSGPRRGSASIEAEPITQRNASEPPTSRSGRATVGSASTSTIPITAQAASTIATLP